MTHLHLRFSFSVDSLTFSDVYTTASQRRSHFTRLSLSLSCFFLVCVNLVCVLFWGASCTHISRLGPSLEAVFSLLCSALSDGGFSGVEAAGKVFETAAENSLAQSVCFNLAECGLAQGLGFRMELWQLWNCGSTVEWLWNSDWHSLCYWKCCWNTACHSVCCRCAGGTLIGNSVCYWQCCGRMWLGTVRVASYCFGELLARGVMHHCFVE